MAGESGGFTGGLAVLTKKTPIAIQINFGGNDFFLVTYFLS